MLEFDIHKPVIGTVIIEIDRPVQQVFSFVAEQFFKNYPKWALEVIEFKPINNNPMEVGALAKQIRIEQGHRVESTFEIKAYEPNRLLLLEGLSDPFRHSFSFESLEQQTCLVESFELLEIELFMRPFEKLIRAAIEEGLRNSVANIQKLLT